MVGGECIHAGASALMGCLRHPFVAEVFVGWRLVTPVQSGYHCMPPIEVFQAQCTRQLCTPCLPLLRGARHTHPTRFDDICCIQERMGYSGLGVGDISDCFKSLTSQGLRNLGKTHVVCQGLNTANDTSSSLLVLTQCS